ncbi:hypothetical protein RND71_006227 [Anisodus tanguticus]|uniref:Uncharacterized protein n=1 Tax=Anisodus tanguticus TaxID=243964 RepID=A0AAE1VW18_9SOLA|nr:hypothetical protein RND71_006227 [Anisodus tanguticus]
MVDLASSRVVFTSSIEYCTWTQIGTMMIMFWRKFDRVVLNLLVVTSRGEHGYRLTLTLTVHFALRRSSLIGSLRTSPQLAAHTHTHSSLRSRTTTQLAIAIAVARRQWFEASTASTTRAPSKKKATKSRFGSILISEMEIGLAVGSAFLSSALNALFDRLTPKGDLMKMFQTDNPDFASTSNLKEWLDELRDAVDGSENVIEEVNYEALRLKVEGQHQNLTETSNPQVSDLNLCLSGEFFLNIKKKLENTIERLEGFEKQIGHLDLTKYLDSGEQEKRKFSTSVVVESEILGRQNEIEELRLQEYVTIEDLGNEYFDELQSRSLFERVPNSSQGNTKKFLMHDLVNDLAQIASSKLCTRLEESQGYHVFEKSQHQSYLIGYGDFEKLKSLYKLEQLRTLLPINIQGGYSFELNKRVLHNILPRLISLRALSLSHCKNKELPNDLFIKLNLLRYSDLSGTEIRKLLDSVCALCNLETLLLSACEYLEEMPPHMEKLINLCRLDISGTSCLKMSLHLSKLKSLHMLVGANVFIGGRSGLRIEDLGELPNLYGSLSFLELQNVVHKREASKANLRGKEHVESLSLEWSGSIADNSQTERDILDELHPHTNIKLLQITGYRGQLPSLKFLAIRGMHRITEVTEEFYCSSFSKKPFNSLQKLEFAQMPEWKQWHALGNGDLETPIQLSNLIEFEVVGSPKVGVLSDQAELFTSQFQGMEQIDVLDVKGCQSLTSLPISILPSTLKRIMISGCGKLKLKLKLRLQYCPEIESFPEGGFPFNLEFIRIYNCEKLVNGRKEWRLQRLPCLRELSICHDGSDEEILADEDWELPCSIRKLFICNLKTLSSQVLKSLTSLQCLVTHNLPKTQSLLEEGLPSSLSTLYLYGHHELHSLPNEGLLHLTSLQRLYISDCPDPNLFQNQQCPPPSLCCISMIALISNPFQ